MANKTFKCTADAGLMSPSYGSGKGSAMWAAYGSNQTRMVLQFANDFSNVGSVTSAILHIRSFHLFTRHSPNVTIRRITSAWSEGSYNGGTSGAGSNAVYYPGPSTTDTNKVVWAPGTKKDAWLTVNITGIVNDWFTGAANYGIMIQETNEGSTTNNWDAWTREGGSGAYITLVDGGGGGGGDTGDTSRYIYLDGILTNEEVALSSDFENQDHMAILNSLTSAVQVESNVTEAGLSFVPRVGKDTDVILREGQGTVVTWNIVNDFSNMASILYSKGSDIDGLPLFTITQDSKNRDILGRNVVRSEDFSSTQDYLQLIGLSRTELKNRRLADKRITVEYTGKSLDLLPGDSFTLYSLKMGAIRIRIDKMAVKESTSSGHTWSMDCERWPINTAPFHWAGSLEVQQAFTWTGTVGPYSNSCNGVETNYLPIGHMFRIVIGGTVSNGLVLPQIWAGTPASTGQGAILRMPGSNDPVLWDSPTPATSYTYTSPGPGAWWGRQPNGWYWGYTQVVDSEEIKPGNTLETVMWYQGSANDIVVVTAEDFGPVQHAITWG